MRAHTATHAHTTTTTILPLPAAVRVLKLLLERLGADFSHAGSMAATAGPALALVNAVAGQPALRDLRPSTLAAALLLASRKAAGGHRAEAGREVQVRPGLGCHHRRA